LATIAARIIVVIITIMIILPQCYFLVAVLPVSQRDGPWQHAAAAAVALFVVAVAV
jgi:hypothetical protein